MTRKQRRLTLIGCALAVLGFASGLVLYALRDSIVFFSTPTMVAEKHVAPGKRFRLGGLVHSQRVLIALTQKGASREDAYKFVQRNAMPVWRGEGDFLTLLKKDPDVKKYLSDADLEEQFDLGYHLKHVDTIFKRVFGEA